MRWSKAVCAALRETRPTWPPPGTETLASGLAAYPLFCDLLANVYLRLEHEVDLERVVEIGDLRFSGF
jgi:hypothetical protein